MHLWRGVDDPSNIFFLFEVRDDARARAFISDPEAVKAAESTGVLDGAYHFLDDAGGY